MIASWEETHLPTILCRYDLQEIFNADEFGLFYQMLPTNTYHTKGERCAGGKFSKVRLTRLAAGNALGEKVPMLVIGKSVTPRWFQRSQNSSLSSLSVQSSKESLDGF